MPCTSTSPNFFSHSNISPTNHAPLQSRKRHKPNTQTPDPDREKAQLTKTPTPPEIPTFAPTPSNPELAALLDNARRRILIPAHLNREQHALVHEPRYGVRMRSEPIRAQVGGVEVQLEHVGPHVRDTPRTYDVFRDAVRLAKTPTDWNNVGLLVAGLFEVAQLKPRPETQMPDAWVERLARSDGYALDLVIRLAAGAERSGVRLRSGEVVGRVLWEVRAQAAKEAWEGEATERALARAEKVVELLESPAHCGGKQVVKGDVRTLPFVIATPLELAAVRALMPAPASGTSAAAAATEGEGEAEAEEGVEEQMQAKAAESVAKQKQARAKVQAYAERLVANLKVYGVEVCFVSLPSPQLPLFQIAVLTMDFFPIRSLPSRTKQGRLFSVSTRPGTHSTSSSPSGAPWRSPSACSAMRCPSPRSTRTASSRGCASGSRPALRSWRGSSPMPGAPTPLTSWRLGTR